MKIILVKGVSYFKKNSSLHQRIILTKLFKNLNNIKKNNLLSNLRNQYWINQDLLINQNKLKVLKIYNNHSNQDANHQNVIKSFNSNLKLKIKIK